MSTLTPATLDPTVWRRWLKDGARLLGRSSTGWGMGFFALFVLRGYLIAHAPPVWGLWAFVGLSGAIELAHFAVFRELQGGHVALGTSLRAIGRLYRTCWGVIGRTLRTRLLVGGLVLFTAQALMHAYGTVPAAPLPPGWGWQLLVALAHSADASVGPLILRLGGVISLILPLMALHGLSVVEASRLQRTALERNRGALLPLLMGFSTALVLTFNPVLAILVPVIELWLAATLSCAYADLFEGGYTLKALAKAPARIRTAHAVRVPVRVR